ncbi:MAG: ABC transporter permease subunit [Rhodobacteraceae bacterium]|jgi:ABC-type transport system involved in multi-copper enzyme maturation permease subunit|nr:ABC transporter permease subunit [Paracoccaceae bacterium]
MTPAPRHVPAARTVAVLARREAAAALGGFGVYIATTVALVAAVWLLLVDVRALDVAGILVPVDPYRAPLDVALLVLALFFAVSAAVSTARDRASGTLEVLFYGPVDETTYLLGKLVGLIVAYAVTLPLVAAGLFGVALLSGFALPGTLPASLVLSLVPAGMVVGFGILLAIGTSRVRSAVLVLGVVAFVMLGAAAANSIVLMVPIDHPSSPVLALRDALAGVNAVLHWVSPFAYMQRIVGEGVAIGAWQTAGIGVAGALVATCVMLALAAAWLRWRGVQRGGE